MSRITCKSCRRLGQSICGRDKCAFKTRAFAPGKLDSERKHRTSVSEYGEQLREKQKVRVSYGLSEKQFESYVTRSTSLKKDETAAPILRLYRELEARLDNVVFRSGFANTRALARQIVSHGHITVNGRRLNIASYKVKEGDVIAVREGSKIAKLFVNIGDKLKDHKSPVWMTVDTAKLETKVSGVPKEAEVIFDLPKVLEYYSR